MKLATFTRDGGTGIGLVGDDEIIDISASGTGLPGTMLELLGAGKAAMEKLSAVAASNATRYPLSDITLKAPVARPPKFFGVGLNYSDHIAETGNQKPDYPTLFNKQSTCVIGPGEAIHLPRVAPKRVDYEGEFGIVIGRRCRHVPKARAAEVIAGYLIVNDVTARDWQGRSPTWTLGKSFDTHGPIGPWIVTPDQIGDPHDLGIKTWVNGELRQSSNTSFLLFDCFYLIEYLSSVFTLEPGDIISTGTSSGVGFKMSPPTYLQAGDTVRIEIENIGILENPVIAEPENTAFISNG